MDWIAWWQSLPTQLNAFARDFGPVAYGITLVALVIRTAIPLGSLIPGGSMIFALGLVAPVWPIPWIAGAVFTLAVASTLGGDLGYRVAQHALTHSKAPGWMRPDPRWLSRAVGLYEKFGVAAIAFSVSQPWACSVSPLICMRLGFTHRAFVLGSLIGSILWVSVIFALGFGAGRAAGLR